jgi:hypothetical protein
MSVHELFDFQKTVLLDWLRHPRAWLLQANPVWGRFETVNRIALFDTKEQAEAYLEASKLPETKDPSERTTEDKYVRSFRSDSLLFDYNLEAGGRSMIVPTLPWYDYEGVSQNPVPPSGPAPDLKSRTTSHPKYGVDYDQGMGGPYSNMDRALPEPQPGSGC